MPGREDSPEGEIEMTADELDELMVGMIQVGDGSVKIIDAAIDRNAPHGSNSEDEMV